MLPTHPEASLQTSPSAASWVELLTEVTDLHLNKLQSDTCRDQLRSSLFWKQILLSLRMASIHSRGPRLLSLLACDRQESPSYDVPSRAARVM